MQFNIDLLFCFLSINNILSSYIIIFLLLRYKRGDLLFSVIISMCMSVILGAFLIPYFIMLVVEGIPLQYIELGIGQKLRKGSIGVWNEIHPYLGGVGVASTITGFMVAMYYNVIICWCLYYLFNSFQKVLPWRDCPTDPKNNDTEVRECHISSSTSYYWYREALNTSPGIHDFGGMQWKMVGCLCLAWTIVFVCMMRGIKSAGKVCIMNMPSCN